MWCAWACSSVSSRNLEVANLEPTLCWKPGRDGLIGSKRLPVKILLFGVPVINRGCQTATVLPLVFVPDDYGRIKRGRVPGEFAIHFAGEIDASDQVLSKSVVHSAQTHGLIAESKGR